MKTLLKALGVIAVGVGGYFAGKNSDKIVEFVNSNSTKVKEKFTKNDESSEEECIEE